MINQIDLDSEINEELTRLVDWNGHSESVEAKRFIKVLSGLYMVHPLQINTNSVVLKLVTLRGDCMNKEAIKCTSVKITASHLTRFNKIAIQGKTQMASS